MYRDKRQSVQLLTRASADAALRERLDEGMRALTAIGNDFRIRHHETTKARSPCPSTWTISIVGCMPSFRCSFALFRSHTPATS